MEYEKVMMDFEACLEAKKLRKVRVDLSEAKKHVGKARANLEVMNYLKAGKYFDWVVISAYYSMYHAALALLALKGYEGKDHRCVMTALRKLYVPAELESQLGEIERVAKLNNKLVRGLDKVRRKRIAAQYEVAEIEPVDSNWAASSASEFVDKAEEIVYASEGISLERVK